jgi:phage-related protein
MPGTIAALSGITDTYPLTTFSAFAITYGAETAMAEYPDGSSQRRNKATNHKRKWVVSHRVSSSVAVTMRAFYRAHIIAPFRFTDVSNGVTYNAVFNAGYSEQRLLSRYTISLSLLEVA